MMTHIICNLQKSVLRRLALAALLGVAAGAAAQQRVLTVGCDGHADFTTLQAAVDAAPESGHTIIKIGPGVYSGRVSIGTRRQPSRRRISLVGAGLDSTVITAAHSRNNIGGRDVRDYATLAVFADDFYAQDLTIANTAGREGGQALALYVAGDRQTFLRCRIAGYQDTHRTKKATRSYYKECVIEGAVDYIYAGGTAWFEECTLRSVAPGYITAPEDVGVSITAADGRPIWLGFVFNRCRVEAAEAAGKVYLGRPWNKDAAGAGSIFLNCDLGGAVAPEGWTLMGGSTGANTSFAEYRSTDHGRKAKVRQRVKWSRQLTARDYSLLSTWEQVDEAFRAATGHADVYRPECVIADHKAILASDYCAPEPGLLAFPTARGFGKLASGGRGGKVVEVTTLADSGPGSLRWALTEAGREDATIVFRVSGIIDIGPNLQRKGENSIRAKLRNVTIAGQTAPGEGIVLRGGKLNLGGSENVIIRNLRSRLGVKADTTATKAANFIPGGAIGIENASNIIIDHCCFGWSGEENMTIYDNHFTTVQWCIVHEGLFNAGHPKGSRGYGCQWGGSPATFHHNLLVSNDSRSPRINGASNAAQDRNVFMEYQNNVNFNWGRQNSCYGGENEAGPGSSHECNFAANYYKPGPAHEGRSYFIELSAARKGKQLDSPSLWYIAGNVMEGNEAATADNWLLVNNRTGFDQSQLRSDTLLYPSPRYERTPASSFADYDLYRTPLETAADAYRHVLALAGTVKRDSVERRLVADVLSGKPLYQGPSAGKPGIVDMPSEADGWPAYASAAPVADADHDGMADDWELANGFDPTDPTDGRKVASAEGYTALEIYLNSLMGEYIPIIKK